MPPYASHKGERRKELLPLAIGGGEAFTLRVLTYVGLAFVGEA
jgi:hypothetical protein